jgi:hypothetical protein
MSAENASHDRDAEMAEYGVRRIAVDYVLYDPYRYSSLKDALAQARRERESGQRE